MGRRTGGKGTVFRLEHESRVLKGNPLRDPWKRGLPVYVPPSYFHEPNRRYPVVYVLSGFTGRGSMLLNDSLWTEPFHTRFDRLLAEGRTKEAVVVFPDASTKYGGSQYVNSVANGRYEDYVVNDVVPFVDRTFRTIPRPEARAVMGKSSGGYGALVLGMRHPERFRLVACHSGDMYFELCYKPDFVRALRNVERPGGFARFFREFPGWRQKKKGDFLPILNTIAMAMAYSPRRPRGSRGVPFELPFDEETGELRESVWKKWRAWDPVEMAARKRGNLKKLRLLFFDCGTRDEFNLHFGARILARRLRKLGVRFVHEEFDDGHSNISYRYDRSLERISEAFPEQ